MITPARDIYSSRADRAAGIVQRRDPVVYGSAKVEPGTGLDAEQLGGYERNGYILLKNFFSAQETQALKREVERLVRDPAIRRREEAITEKGTDVVRSVFMVHKLSKLLGRMSQDMRLVGIARQILGSDVYIHQSRANMKPGFKGKEFYWHSDFETWHVEDGMPAMRALSCSVLLTDNDASNGPLMVVPGSHRQFVSCVGETPQDHYKQSLKKQEYGVPDPVSLQLLVDQGGIDVLSAPAGSVVFFDCNIMHGSNSNISPYPRSNVFMVYNSVENTLNPPRYGLNPRPEFIATRESFAPIQAVEPGYLRSV
ncbi:ectoine hydroxylase [Pigmentiphaga sp. GD03639]|jgi:ectoine hydroxylase|uniref:Ectoine hydroxylase n=1 Tax=Pigmentiphaga daeguensis TaxID=414049 RepID=A0ABN1C7R7_9BURK|nr:MULTISPECIES: ectoine hydroxylase [unclassified Pigmentiphaga]MDH2236643.1 ectoine hydroxylase [Pigmentiphaga sp. GD03639]OVZ61893.1 ectoine hydroxylase [Pigmentiphaga sp. NML030171]